MIDVLNTTIRDLVGRGFEVSVQCFLKPNRPGRWTAIARFGRGERLQGWGFSGEEALADLERRNKDAMWRLRMNGYGGQR